MSNDELLAAAKKLVAASPSPPPRSGPVELEDFFAYLPAHSFLYSPTRDLWPAASVDGRLKPVEIDGKPVKASSWLDKHRAVQQLTWHPDEPPLITDRLFDGGSWVRHPGAAVFNLYRPPEIVAGDATLAQPWIDHVRRIFPNYADHIIKWLAHRLQRPGEKINHALVIGGAPGIGKDMMLVPVIVGVGAWNWTEISPPAMLGRFNGWIKAVIVRVSEVRDLGDSDRFAFYDHSKVYIASPPEVIRVDEKHLREYPVANVAGIVITTNHLGDGIYLPADDRRHFVAWSEASKDDFASDYWDRLYRWYKSGGIAHVCAYLRAVDIRAFDPKAPPPKTPAFWAIVNAGESPESGELRDVIELLGSPPAVTLAMLVEGSARLQFWDLNEELKSGKNRRSIPHKLERVGLIPVRNPDAPKEGNFRIQGKRQVVYAQRSLTAAEQIRAAQALVRDRT